MYPGGIAWYIPGWYTFPYTQVVYITLLLPYPGGVYNLLLPYPGGIYASLMLPGWYIRLPHATRVLVGVHLSYLRVLVGVHLSYLRVVYVPGLYPRVVYVPGLYPRVGFKPVIPALVRFKPVIPALVRVRPVLCSTSARLCTVFMLYFCSFMHRF